MKRHRHTPIHSVNLCESCKFSMIVHGLAESQQIIRCKLMELTLKWQVSECDDYELKGTPTLYEMEKMAWLIEPQKNGTGFHARRLTDKEIS